MTDEDDYDPNFCSVPDCPKVIAPSKMFCTKHWDQVPLPLRQEIGEAVLAEDETAMANCRARAVEAVERRR